MNLRRRVWIAPMSAVAVLVCSLLTVAVPTASTAAAATEANDEGLFLYADSTWTGTYSLISADGSTWQRGARDLFQGGKVLDADFSPDGRSIAFLRTCPSCDPVDGRVPNDIRVLTVGASYDRLVSRGSYYGSLAWSPDGSRIAAFGDGGIVAVEADTGAKQTLLRRDDGVVIHSSRGMSWSVNEEIAFVADLPDCTSEVCSRNDLYTIDVVAGSGPRPFGRYPDDDAAGPCAPEADWTQPAWSPDGLSIAAYVGLEQPGCDGGDDVCDGLLVRAERAESVPTTLRVIDGGYCYDERGYVGDLIEPRWSDDGARLLAGWIAHYYDDHPSAVIVDTAGGPSTPVTTLGDLDPVADDAPLPFDWQPCPGGTCVAWPEPTRDDRIAQITVTCGRAAFGWTTRQRERLIAKGERVCSILLSNVVAHDLLRLTEGAERPLPEVFGLLVTDQIGPHRHSHQTDPVAEPVQAQLDSYAEDWAIDRMAVKLATTSPGWLRRAFRVETYDVSPGTLSRYWSAEPVREGVSCLQFDMRLVGAQQLVRARVVESGAAGLTYRKRRIDGRRTTVPVRLGLNCGPRGYAVEPTPSKAWTRPTQDHMKFRGRWDG